MNSLNCKNSKPHILLVEDEDQLGRTLEMYLNQKDFDCIWKKSGVQAYTYFLANQKKIEIVLLDVGLPDINGIDLANKILDIKNCILIFLSAINDPQIRLSGLETGAYDYITKPFALKELLLRINRSYKNSFVPDEITFGKLHMLLNQYLLIDADRKVTKLTHKECSVLKMLYLAKGTVLSRDEIIDKVWGIDSYPSNRTIDNCIVKFRKWYETDADNPIYIESVRGVGYKMVF